MLKKIEFVKEFSEIGDYFDMPVNTYSSGMKSRLAFGISMAFDFEVYLIDEILSVGDKNFKAKCTSIMEKKREESNIIMVSHDLKNMKEMCDSGILLRDAKLEYFENINDAIKEYEKE
jgi:capsular polysaccharide transport system ATP-binding protein